MKIYSSLWTIFCSYTFFKERILCSLFICLLCDAIFEIHMQCLGQKYRKVRFVYLSSHVFEEGYIHDLTHAQDARTLSICTHILQAQARDTYRSLNIAGDWWKTIIKACGRRQSFCLFLYSDHVLLTHMGVKKPDKLRVEKHFQFFPPHFNGYVHRLLWTLLLSCLLRFFYRLPHEQLQKLLR